MNAIIPHLIAALPLAVLLGMGAAGSGSASPAEDARVVGELDTRYQEAVKHNDAATMAQIFNDDMILVTGAGKVFTGEQLLADARNKTILWEQQDEEPGSQKVRVWGDTAVVTAKLWLKGSQGGQTFDRKLWFSDTYVRTPAGWRYSFGQSSISLPADAK
jgi:ketosteroid isomerase-like protein